MGKVKEMFMEQRERELYNIPQVHKAPKEPKKKKKNLTFVGYCSTFTA